MKKTRPKKETVKKISPYTTFNKWLFDYNQTSVLDEECMKSLSCFSIMQSFSSVQNVNIFLNEYFNDLYVHQLPKEEFFKFLKEIVIKKKLTQRNMCFIKHFKNDVNIAKIWLKMPYLKKYEIQLFLNEIEQDARESLEEMLGITIPKKKKITKKRRVENNVKIESNKPKLNMLSLKAEFFK